MATPEFSWPHDMRLAVSVVVNVEEGAEESVADGDRAPEPVDELQVVMSKGRNFGNESNYDYGIRAGAPRVLKLLRDYGVTATFTAAALALERAPDLAKEIVADGHEICAHGYRWAHQHWMKEDMERDFIRKAAESIDKTCGKRPAGWLSRYVLTENTRRLLVEEGGFLYDSDAYNDELPYWTVVDDKPHLVVPYSLTNNDVKFMRGYLGTAADYFAFHKDAFDMLYCEGAAAPKMMSVGIHMRITGHPARAAGLARFLDYVAGFDDVWVCRRDDIAKHWITTHPY